MISEEYLKVKKTEKLKLLANPPEEEFAKMNYKEKQAVYRARNKLCKVFHRGGTYVKRKDRKV